MKLCYFQWIQQTKLRKEAEIKVLLHVSKYEFLPIMKETNVGCQSHLGPHSLLLLKGTWQILKFCTEQLSYYLLWFPRVPHFTSLMTPVDRGTRVMHQVRVELFIWLLQHFNIDCPSGGFHSLALLPSQRREECDVRFLKTIIECDFCLVKMDEMGSKRTESRIFSRISSRLSIPE